MYIFRKYSIDLLSILAIIQKFIIHDLKYYYKVQMRERERVLRSTIKYKRERERERPPRCSLPNK